MSVNIHKASRKLHEQWAHKPQFNTLSAKSLDLFSMSQSYNLQAHYLHNRLTYGVHQYVDLFSMSQSYNLQAHYLHNRLTYGVHQYVQKEINPNW